jgi:anaerobic magnesium-protoporphyrin IX monomethyl ester cyclase
LNISFGYISNLCRELCRQDVNIFWASSLNMRNINYSVLKQMKSAGCRQIIWGIESGSERVLRLMNKTRSLMDMENTLKEAHMLGIENRINIMVGFPTETDKDFNDTARFFERIYKYISDTVLFEFVLLYNTAVYLKPKNYGIKDIFYHDPILKRIGFKVFGYSEIDGLPWHKITKRNKARYKALKKKFLDYPAKKDFRYS